MEHEVTWFSYLPGYIEAEHLVGANARGLMGHPAVLQHVIAALVVTALVVLMGLHVRGAFARAGSGVVVPGPEISSRNVIEVVGEALYGQTLQIIGPEGPRYFPVLATLAMFVFFCNLIGLIPGFEPPTNNWNTTFACGIFVFLYYNYHGLRTQGLGHIAHMANPVGAWWGWFLAPLMFPIELISHIARPFSLGVRLAANMVADHAVLIGFLTLVPVLVPLPLMVLGLMVSVIQTLVFVLLSTIYIGLSVAHGHEETHAHEHAQAAAAEDALSTRIA